MPVFPISGTFVQSILGPNYRSKFPSLRDKPKCDSLSVDNFHRIKSLKLYAATVLPIDKVCIVRHFPGYWGIRVKCRTMWNVKNLLESVHA